MYLQYLRLLLFSPVILFAEFGMLDVLNEGTLHGQIKLFSYDVDKVSDEDIYATALGGYLKYSTDINKSIYGTVHFHMSQPVGYSKKREDTALFNNNGEGLTVNSEAYLGWRETHRVLKVGNFMLNTPMMNDDTTRIVPWSYQGFAYTGDVSDDTTIQVNFIRQIRSHTSDAYKKESASGEIGSGITMLGVHYNGYENLDMTSYYYFAPDLYSTFIVQGDYKLVIDRERLICASVQYFNSGNGGKYAQIENKNGGDDIDLLALRVGYNSEDWMTSLSYSQNFGISGIVQGYGGLSKVLTTSMVANGRGNYKPETWMLKISYTLPFIYLGMSEVATTLTNTRTHDSRGDDFDAYYLHWLHRFNVDTSLFVRFENIDFLNDKSDVKYLRVIAAYDF